MSLAVVLSDEEPLSREAIRNPRPVPRTLDTDAVAKLIAAAADVALIIDREGVVVDLAFHDQQLGTELTGSAQWIGMPWIETVTPESRAKVRRCWRRRLAPWCRDGGTSIIAAPNGSMPILYTAVQVGDGRMVAVGRDLKPLASLQQRLVEAQQSMERDYSRLRHVEMRYRLLFQMSLEPFLIIDGYQSSDHRGQSRRRRVCWGNPPPR